MLTEASLVECITRTAALTKTHRAALLPSLLQAVQLPPAYRTLLLSDTNALGGRVHEEGGVRAPLDARVMHKLRTDHACEACVSETISISSMHGTGFAYEVRRIDAEDVFIIDRTLADRAARAPSQMIPQAVLVAVVATAVAGG